MRPRIIGISGAAGSGKDAVADVLVQRYNFVRIALADPLKRICMDVWPFSPQQLWGPSERRVEPPMGRDRPSAREALQRLGTEWGRKLDEDVWVLKAMWTANTLLNEGGEYTRAGGLRDLPIGPPSGVVIPDTRFDNEASAIRSDGGEVWQVRRVDVRAVEGGVDNHASEVGIPTSMVNQIILNDGVLEDLVVKVDRLMEAR